MKRSMRITLYALLLLGGCRTTVDAGKRTNTISANRDNSDASIRINGDIDNINLINVSARFGDNRLLIATIEGGPVRAVWLACKEMPQKKAFLTRVGNGKYHLNLNAPEVYEALVNDVTRYFNVFAEFENGSVIKSIGLAYVLHKSMKDVHLRLARVSIRINQHGTVEVPGSQGDLSLNVGDISFGRVGGHVYSSGFDSIELNEMREGEGRAIVIGKRVYVLAVARLVNLLFGGDYAEFDLVSEEFWPTYKTERLLDKIAHSGAIITMDGREMTGQQFLQYLGIDPQLIEQTGLTVDNLIEQVAARSPSPDKPVQVCLPEGESIDAVTWLQRLDRETRVLDEEASRLGRSRRGVP